MFIWILLAVIYVMCLVTLGMTTLRKGHTLLFWIGIIFPLLWMIGACSAPTSQASADMARGGLRSLPHVERLHPMTQSSAGQAPHSFLADSRLALAVLNHLRYQGLNRVFGVSRDQANVVTVIVLLSAADGAYEAARRITRMRMRVSGTDAAIGGFALREAGLRFAGPAAREIPGFPTLVALGVLGGLAAPSLLRTAQRMRAAEQRLRAAEARIRRERIARYAAAQDRGRASAA